MPEAFRCAADLERKGTWYSTASSTDSGSKSFSDSFPAGPSLSRSNAVSSGVQTLPQRLSNDSLARHQAAANLDPDGSDAAAPKLTSSFIRQLHSSGQAAISAAALAHIPSGSHKPPPAQALTSHTATGFDPVLLESGVENLLSPLNRLATAVAPVSSNQQQQQQQELQLHEDYLRAPEFWEEEPGVSLLGLPHGSSSNLASGSNRSSGGIIGISLGNDPSGSATTQGSASSTTESRSGSGFGSTGGTGYAGAQYGSLQAGVDCRINEASSTSAAAPPQIIFSRITLKNLSSEFQPRQCTHVLPRFLPSNTRCRATLDVA